MKAAAIVAFALFPCAALGQSDPGAPVVDGMVWQPAGSVCRAWQQGAEPAKSSQSTLVFIAFPSAEPPFGMRGLMKIDGVLHELRQIAHARQSGAISVHYRTQGYRNYDVRLNLAGLSASTVAGEALTGTMIVSRFGLFNQIEISGSCGDRS
ncbi:MAG: hypothetical protein WCC66_13810 [Rhizobiaceae bacterium]